MKNRISQHLFAPDAPQQTLGFTQLPGAMPMSAMAIYQLAQQQAHAQLLAERQQRFRRRVIFQALFGETN